MLVAENYSKKYTLLLLFILLLPSKRSYLYFGCVSLLSLVFLDCKKIQINVFSKLFAILFFYVFFTAGVRYFTTFTPNIRDFMEAFRFVPSLLIFLSIYKWGKIKLKNYIDASFIYILLDAIVSYMQSKSMNILGILDLIKNLYNSDNHFEISFLMDHRILGLSSGPGQHGTLIYFLLTVMFTTFFIYEERKKVSFFGTVIAFFIIVSSQSRTALVATIIVIFLFIFFNVLKGNLKQRMFSITLSSLIIVLIPTVIKYLEKFSYLFALFTNGTNISSYSARENKWMEIINLTFEKPEWLLIGHGKDFFGMDSRAMDSEYIYIYSVYGLPFLSIMLVLLLFFWIRSIKEWKYTSPFLKILFFITIGGAIISYTSAFFSDPKILTITSLLICSEYFRKQYPDDSEKVSRPVIEKRTSIVSKFDSIKV